MVFAFNMRFVITYSEFPQIHTHIQKPENFWELFFSPNAIYIFRFDMVWNKTDLDARSIGIYSWYVEYYGFCHQFSVFGNIHPKASCLAPGKYLLSYTYIFEFSNSYIILKKYICFCY